MTKDQARRDTRLNKLLIFYPRLLYTCLFNLKVKTCMDAEHNHATARGEAGMQLGRQGSAVVNRFFRRTNRGLGC
jgi:hypothetical protein